MARNEFTKILGRLVLAVFVMAALRLSAKTTSQPVPFSVRMQIVLLPRRRFVGACAVN
jgi:hypothetical protein